MFVNQNSSPTPMPLWPIKEGKMEESLTSSPTKEGNSNPTKRKIESLLCDEKIPLIFHKKQRVASATIETIFKRIETVLSSKSLPLLMDLALKLITTDSRHLEDCIIHFKNSDEFLLALLIRTKEATLVTKDMTIWNTLMKNIPQTKADSLMNHPSFKEALSKDRVLMFPQLNVQLPVNQAFIK